ncbi:MAG: A/G-specific adenine glycosylase [Parcubacteria group bacterium]|nr:A/G-specific adenine glycosylase [Parcubacteria group bacterium]
MNKLSSRDIARFQTKIWQYYKKHGRDLPWRHTVHPYRIVVSEIMLQQTQVKRGLAKYPLFIKAFPSFRALARVPLARVLQEWSGLGYNRRAVNLHRLANIVVKDYSGRLPSDFESLKNLPGIGSATAASIRAFAFNEPTPFIETNIRTVFIHHFFENRTRQKIKVDDKDILKLVEQTLPADNPREWYWALMDYGTHIKEMYGNPNVIARAYKKQSRFKGSDREIRGAVLKALIGKPEALSLNTIIKYVGGEKLRIQKQLSALIREGFLEVTKRKGLLLYSLSTSTNTKPSTRILS